MALHHLPDLIQGTDEWHDQRRGIVTASAVGRLITQRTLGALEHACPECAAPVNDPCRSKVKANTAIKSLHPGRAAVAKCESTIVLDVADDETSRGLTAMLVAERITGYTDPTYMNDDMLRGVEDEPRAVEKYGEHYAPVTTTGFMVRDDWGFRIGYSPDGLVSDDGLIEVKSRRQRKHLTTILSDAVPTENMAQLQCGLLVSGRDWIDYVSYCGGMPLWVKRVEPDPRWFEVITVAVEKFEGNAEEMVAAYIEATEGLPATERVIELEMVI